MPTNLLYSPATPRRKPEFQIGSEPWTPAQYLEYFQQLRPRPLYFELAQQPQGLKLILDGPSWERHNPKCLQTANIHLGIEQTGFVVLSYMTVNGQHHGSIQDYEAGSDLQGALDYFNDRVRRVRSQVETQEINLTSGQLSTCNIQDFHHAFLSLLNGTADNPKALAPDIDRQRRFAPKTWLRRVTGGKTLHLHISPGVWYRLRVSGWRQQQLRVRLTAIIGSELTNQQAKKLGPAIGREFSLVEHDIPNLFEYPQYCEDSLGADPRNLSPAYGTVEPVYLVPNLTPKEVEQLFDL